MSATERRKGATGEREVVRAMRAAGWDYAGRSSNGRSQTGHGDILNPPAGTSWEVKRSEKASVWKWWEQAEGDAGGRAPIVAFRRSRSPWLCVIELDELLALLALRERG